MRFGALAGWTVASGDSLVVSMTTSVDEIASNDIGAAFQASGGHTLYGAATYFDADQYLWTSVNGIGVDPGVSGTAHEVVLSGTAPFSAVDWAFTAETVITSAGYSTARTSGSITVSGNSIDNAGAVLSQNALVSFVNRGSGSLLGATDEAGGSSTDGNTTGWVQVLPANVPSSAFRVIGFGVLRGSNVGTGIRMAVASVGTADGDPENAVVDHDMTVGDSGANSWHYEYFDAADVVTYSGGERLFIGTHGDGASSSVFGGSSVNDGLFEIVGGPDDGDNLWLTDGTSGSETAFVTPVGSVTAAFNFGLQVRLIIQEAPYQSDGGYRVIGGAVPGLHDGTLQPNETPLDNIFVTWRIETPDIDDLFLMDTHAYFAAHASGSSNQVEFGLWNPLGGTATFEGDTLVQIVGVSSDTQGTGWSSIQSSSFAVSSGTVYRHSIKGGPNPGEENLTILGVWLGTAGADSQAEAGYPVYGPAGIDIPGTEREVDGQVDETIINFDPTVQTASPIVSDGTVISPNNLPMIAHYWGKPAPSVVAS